MDKFELFKEMLKDRISGFESDSTIEDNCWSLAKELNLKYNGCFIYEEIGERFVDVELMDKNEGNYCTVVVCFG